MFIYENGLPVDYIPTMNYNSETEQFVRESMMNWIRTAPGQVRVRVGKIGRMQGQEVNLKRMENE